MTNKIKTNKLDYELPKQSIRQVPYSRRDLSKILNVHTKEITTFRNLRKFIPENSTLIINTTSVQKVKISLTKKYSGGKAEIFIIKLLDRHTFQCLIKTNAKKSLNQIYYVEKIEMSIKYRTGDIFTVKLHNSDCDTLISNYGSMPLPPYIKDNKNKYKAYQSEFAEGGFSVASPTAGLHFTLDLINEYKSLGIKILNINLNIGLGTFLPIRAKYITDHKMHNEEFHIPKSTILELQADKNNNRKIICVGTSSLRAIETCFENKTPKAEGVTNLFIKRGYKFRLANGLITNFHAPKSSLLAIIDSLLYDEWLNTYNYALKSGLSFLSFGDSMYIDIDKCRT